MATKLQKTTILTIGLLQELTDNFSDERKIGQGAYGKVYLAKLENGEDIAVKVLHSNISLIDDDQFQREFTNLMMLEHPNIVRLVGYCYQTQHQAMPFMGKTIFAERTYRALCFEYMQNGSLQKHLSDECSGLDWHIRYKIIKGACEGLKHMHQGFEKPIYHLDIKPDNILLDNNMVPKLADFGLSKLFGDQQTMITQSPIGTLGYLPIEYFQGHIVSSKLDIFSLGVVIIKIIGGPEAYTRSFDMSHEDFLDQVQEKWRERMQKCDACRPLEAYCEQITICMKLALTCTENDRHKRPNIQDIIKQLDDTEAIIDKALSWSASSHSRMKGDLVMLRTITGSEAIPDADAGSDFPVLVQVMAAPPWCRVEEMPRPSIDIVVVFDTMYPYNWHTSYLTAMKSVVKKLSLNDRLSVVSLKTHPYRLMELTCMTDQGKADALDLVTIKDNFATDYRSNNVAAGLREGAQILRGREAEEGDSGVGCILLLSFLMKAIPTQTQHEISPEFPVHTFGLSNHSHNPESMKYIADQTSATYSFFEGYLHQDVMDGMELFMDSIMRVAATSIMITIRAHEGVVISSIESGSYDNNVNSDKLSAEIEIRDIYAGEQKNFIVYLTVAEGKKKLVTVGGQYWSLNARSNQLPDTDLIILRPQSGCLPAKVAMHDDVAAELARIRLVKGLSALVEPGKCLNIMHMEKLWDSVRLPKNGQGPPQETLSHLGRYVDEMKNLVCVSGVNPKKIPYLMSWLSCHQWQRATTKGSYYYDSGAFTLAQPGDADEEDDD